VGLDRGSLNRVGRQILIAPSDGAVAKFRAFPGVKTSGLKGSRR